MARKKRATESPVVTDTACGAKTTKKATVLVSVETKRMILELLKKEITFKSRSSRSGERKRRESQRENRRDSGDTFHAPMSVTESVVRSRFIVGECHDSFSCSNNM